MGYASNFHICLLKDNWKNGLTLFLLVDYLMFVDYITNWFQMYLKVANKKVSDL